MTTEELGRRERKRLQTREAIEAAALALFAERGFESTTVTDIAERADVSRRTFFDHFPAKEDVLFAELPALQGAFDAHMAARGAQESVFDALRSWIDVSFGDEAEADEERKRCRRAIVRSTPLLEERERALLGEFESRIAREAARDLGTGPDDLRAQLVGTAALTALLEVDRRAGEDPDPARALALLDQAITFLQGGLEALRQKG
jgi:AcrR family transcriptional regulator